MNQEQVLELIDCSRHGDKTAFGKLVSEFQPLVFRLAFRLLCNEDEAKDIVQETFIKIWLSLDKYNVQYKFSTWIYKIAGNLCYDKLRSMKYFPEETGIPATNPGLNISSPEDVESTVINKELKELIICFTNQLTPKQKLVFTLSDIEGLEFWEIEKITGLSAAKIKSNLYLARKHIKDKVNAIIS